MTISLRWFREEKTNLLPFYNCMVLVCEIFSLLHPRMLYAKLGWNWPKTRRFLDFVNVFLLFCNHLPVKKGWPYIWTNFNTLHPRMLCAKFGWNWPIGSWEDDFLISSMYFCYFVHISPWKKAWPFMWINLKLLHPRILCANFGQNWPNGSWEKEF